MCVHVCMYVCVQMHTHMHVYLRLASTNVQILDMCVQPLMAEEQLGKCNCGRVRQRREGQIFLGGHSIDHLALLVRGETRR